MKLPIVVVVVFLLAGCAASPAKPHTTPTFAAGTSAVAMANAITGCKGVKELPVAPSAKGLASIAGCSLDNFPIQILSWDSAADATPSSELDGGGAEYYTVDGPTWTVIAGVDGDLAGQKDAMQKVARALGGKVVHVTA